MTKLEFLQKVEELMELNAGTLTGAEELDSLQTWDSLVVLGFLAFADEQFGLLLAPGQLAEAKTVNDLALLLGDRITE